MVVSLFAGNTKNFVVMKIGDHDNEVKESEFAVRKKFPGRGRSQTRTVKSRLIRNVSENILGS